MCSWLAYLYGLIMLVFPMLFCILSSNELIPRHVDRGSMKYLLSDMKKRETVAFTKMKVMVIFYDFLTNLCTDCRMSKRVL